MIVEKLKAARALLSKPGQWCQGSSAATSNGRGTYATSPAAASWCAIGAYSHVSNGGPAPNELYNALYELVGGTSIVEFNDHPDRKLEDVLHLYDKAIELADG